MAFQCKGGQPNYPPFLQLSKCNFSGKQKYFSGELGTVPWLYHIIVIEDMLFQTICYKYLIFCHIWVQFSLRNGMTPLNFAPKHPWFCTFWTVLVKYSDMYMFTRQDSLKSGEFQLFIDILMSMLHKKVKFPCKHGSDIAFVWWRHLAKLYSAPFKGIYLLCLSI